MLRNTVWRTLCAFALLSVLTAPFAVAQEAAETTPAMTLDEVLAMHFDALGGLDKIEGMKTARYTGKMTMGPGMEVPFIMEWKRPNMVRMEFVVQGQTGTQAFDGETAWMHMPFMGRTEPEVMPEDQAKGISEMAESIEGPLVNWKEKGHTVEYLGTEDVDGTMAHKLHVTMKNGDERTVYLDADYGLEFKTTAKTTVQGQEIIGESGSGDYKEVDGLMIPHSMEARQPGNPVTQVITIDKAEINVDISDEAFAMPAAAADNDNEAGNG